MTKIPIFCPRPDKNAYRRKLKDRSPPPPSPIARLFAVTQECTCELLGQNNIAQRVGRGSTLFPFDKMVAWREIKKYMEMPQ